MDLLYKILNVIKHIVRTLHFFPRFLFSNVFRRRQAVRRRESGGGVFLFRNRDATPTRRDATEEPKELPTREREEEKRRKEKEEE